MTTKTNKSITGIDFDKLWRDPKYIALHDRKTKLWAAFQNATVAAYQVAEPFKAGYRAKAEKAEAAHTRALKRIYAYEAKHGA